MVYLAQFRQEKTPQRLRHRLELLFVTCLPHPKRGLRHSKQIAYALDGETREQQG